MTERPEDFSVHRFVRELFEDLSLTLPSLGCQFRGDVTENALTAHGSQTLLKTKLFLLFADLATESSLLDVKFRPSIQDENLQLGFFCEPFSAKCTALPQWDGSLFETFVSSEGQGFRLTLPAGLPLDAGPPIHWRELSQMYGGAANGRKVLDSFLERSGVLLSELQRAVETQSPEEVLRWAHTLKGSARGVTAQALAEASLQLEMLGRSRDLSSAPDLYKALAVTYDEFIRWVREGQR